jgi:hypothetical protein
MMLRLDCPTNSAIQPISVGIPLPRGQFTDRSKWWLLDAKGREIAVQSQPLSRWFDGSVRWMLLDFLAGPLSAGSHEWTLCSGAAPCKLEARACCVQRREREVAIDTGAASFRVVNNSGQASVHVAMDNREILDPDGMQFGFIDSHGKKCTPEFGSANVECSGPVRTTVRLEGRLPNHRHIRFVTQLCFFAGTSYLRVRHSIHNSRRARHRGNLWDLGDAGSERFCDMHLSLSLADSQESLVNWSEHPDGPVRDAACPQRFEIYQESSGGENWRSRNHVNARGEVPLSLRGYRIRVDTAESFGQRATPTLTWRGRSASVTVAVPEFWQQFPKAIEIDQRRLFVRLFPQQFADGFELQGGERKTHATWFCFGPQATPNDLNWVHQPIFARLHADQYSSIADFRLLAPAHASPGNPLDEYLGEAIAGPKSLFAKREVIDEFGWRNYGDINADHENAYYSGPPPIISHYNNQFDSIFGALLQFVRTGDRRWRDISDPLARHVIDIDIYHTEEDRAVYRGGLFWMTDHYRDAATATHRTFSKANCRAGQSYGGGPGNEHNFTTGLLYYYFLTGDPLAYAAVVSLADWTIRRDDGRQAPFAWLDSGPTGLASFTTDPNYHGPGRGAGLSLNALVDGWLLTDRSTYLDYAEKLIRRCIHPADDVASLDLLNAELRWSYTIFLAALCRYLRHKADAQQIDFMYSYAQTALLRYATWMVEHECPYFDRRSQLEFPTETWPAQEFRKANVLRQAAAHADEPLRSRLLTRGQELADRAWSDLLSFESRHVSRAVAIMMTEGNLDLWYRFCREETAPSADRSYDFGSATRFVPRRERLKVLIRSPRLWAKRIVQLARRNSEPSC